MIQKKATFDGVYYQVVLISQGDLQYQVVLYWIPEIDYL